MVMRSSWDFLHGLKNQELHFNDVWCDLDLIRGLHSAGLIEIDPTQKTISLTDKGQSALKGSSAPLLAAHQPLWRKRATGHRRVQVPPLPEHRTPHRGMTS